MLLNRVARIYHGKGGKVLTCDGFYKERTSISHFFELGKWQNHGGLLVLEQNAIQTARNITQLITGFSKNLRVDCLEASIGR